ncbi:MAG: hypothetical protein H0Z40_11665 [Desulfotomaculum sp.]|nr:hypothetical protein [Desulfotomaculum sp.]
MEGKDRLKSGESTNQTANNLEQRESSSSAGKLNVDQAIQGKDLLAELQKLEEQIRNPKSQSFTKTTYWHQKSPTETGHDKHDKFLQEINDRLKRLEEKLDRLESRLAQLK